MERETLPNCGRKSTVQILFFYCSIAKIYIYFWALLIAQIVKNPPAVWETWVRSLGWEDPLEEGMATHSSILAWRIPMDGRAWWARVHGVAKSRTRLSTAHHIDFYNIP